MLDVETKSRINTARDILVGKVPDPKSQVEQITIALIYKFMDDMDVESEELGGKRTFFVGEYAKYAWRKIFDPRQSGYELLNLYSEAIDKMDINPGVPKLFRDIFKNAYLPYRDPETLKSFLKIINEFDYSHSEKLGDAFEYLLSVLGSQGDAGQFRTPRHIIDFMVEIVDPKKGETILDPACGTAGFLISSYKHIIRQNSSNYNPDEHNGISSNGDQSVADRIISTNGYAGDKLTADDRKILAKNIHGYDISPDMVRLSLVNMYLHGIKDPKIFEYDTLTSEDNWHHFSDVILANPPFMSPKGGIRPHKRFSVQSNRSEVLFVNYIAEHLTSNGRAAVIVPEGIIFQSGKAYKQLRKKLVDECLVGVISLPAGVFNPYAGVKTSILWLDKALAKKTDKILFVKIENDGFDLGAQRRAIKGNDLIPSLGLLKDYHGSIIEGRPAQINNENALSIEKTRIGDQDDFNLSFDRYVSQTKLVTDFNTIPLKELCEFNNGLWTGKKGSMVRVKVIRNTNFRKDGFIDWTNIAELDVEQNQFANRELLHSDIVLEKSGGGPTQPVGRVVLFNNNERGFSYSNFTSRIRVTSNDLSPTFLWLILRDFYERGKTEKFQKQTSGIRNLDFNLYKEIQIPLPPVSIQDNIIAEIESYQKIIDGARQVVENYKPRIDIDPEWAMVELGNEAYFQVEAGGTPSSKVESYWNGGIEWATLVDLPQSDYISEINATVRKISDVGLKNSSAKLIPENSIIVSTRATIGRVAINKIPLATNQGFKNIIIKNKFVVPYFVALMVKGLEAKMNELATGGTFKELSKTVFCNLQIPLPDVETQTQLVEQIMKEQEIIQATRFLITIYETKIKDRIAKVWGE